MTFLTTVLHILQTILQFTAAQHIFKNPCVCGHRLSDVADSKHFKHLAASSELLTFKIFV